MNGITRTKNLVRRFTFPPAPSFDGSRTTPRCCDSINPGTQRKREYNTYSIPEHVARRLYSEHLRKNARSFYRAVIAVKLHSRWPTSAASLISSISLSENIRVKSLHLLDVQIFQVFHKGRVVFLGSCRRCVSKHLGDGLKIASSAANLMTQVPNGAGVNGAYAAHTCVLSFVR